MKIISRKSPGLSFEHDRNLSLGRMASNLSHSHCVMCMHGALALFPSPPPFTVGVYLVAAHAIEYSHLIDADIVCARAKNHYEPGQNLDTDSETVTDASAQLKLYQDNFRRLHANMSRLMYFSWRGPCFIFLIVLIMSWWTNFSWLCYSLSCAY